MKKIILTFTIIAGVLSFAAPGLHAQDAPAAVAAGASPAAGTIAAAAGKFLATLDEAQRGKAVYDFKDDAQRRRWSNLPTSFVKRGGLRMGDLTQPQRDAALAVVAAVLSPQGYEKVTQIVEGDETLKKNDRGGRGGPAMFGRDEYYISFLGQPSATEPWMIQFGGHHLAINLTLVGEKGTLAPSHTAAQPAFLNSKARPYDHWAVRRTSPSH